MSKTVDERVVEMRFDNKQFEQNVQTSLSTLDKLKHSLNLDGAAKGLENINSTAQKCNMSGLTNAVETVHAKFSAFEVMAITALSNITNSVINTGKQMLHSLTMEPISQGFEEYELKMGSIQTIMMSTGASLEEVNGYLNELNTYSDKTIYSFQDMTSNIGKFTNAGVKLEDAVMAIQGVSNEAAISGANANEASRAMYNFAQALSAGYVKLIDWKSIENANMATVEFKTQLLEAAVAAGTVTKTTDGMYKVLTKNNQGSTMDETIDATRNFNDSLQFQWMTTEVLVNTLRDYADETTDIGKKAFAAAQEVKTFTQLMDTLKEAVGSGWAQTWEILFGDFEEAKTLWTSLSTSIGGFIDSMSDARNSMLQGWKDMGGRTALIDAAKNAFEGLASVIKPISEGFREIFPPMTAGKLYNMTTALKEFTSHLKLSDSASANLKSTFKGIFAILDIGKQAFSAVFNAIFPLFGGLDNLGGGILKVTGSFGDWLVNLDEIIMKNDIFNKAIQGVIEFVKKAGYEFKAFAKSVQEKFNLPSLDEIKQSLKDFLGMIKEKIQLPGLELIRTTLERIHERISQVGENTENMKSGVIKAIDAMGNALANCKFLQLLQSLWVGVETIVGGIVDALGGLADTLIEKIGNADFSGIIDVLNGLSIGGIALAISKFLKSFTEPFEGLSGLLENVTGILDGVRGCFEAYQTQLKAGTLLKIAAAIAILAASIVAVSLIDSNKLSASLGAMTLLFTELMGSMAIFNKISGSSSNTMKACTTMIAISLSISILAGALKKLAELDWEGIDKGLIGIAGLSAIVVASSKIMAGDNGQMIKGATGLVIFAAAVKVLASVCKDLSVLNWSELGTGLAGVGVLLGEVAIFLNTAKFSGKSITTATGMVILAAAIKILGTSCKDFGGLQWNEIGKGLVAIGGLLAEIAIFTNLTGNAKHVISTGIALIEIAAAIKIFASAVTDFSGLQWEEIGRGLTAMGGALAEVAIAVNVMPKNMVGIGTGLVIVAAALEIMTDVMKKFGVMQWEEIGRGLTVMGGALAELAIALNVMNGTLTGSAALIVAATALGIMTPVLSVLGALSWEAIAKGLISIAGAFTVLGVAGSILAPLVPAILGLSGAFSLIGVGVLAIGAGLLAAGTGLSALAVGFTALAASLAAGATAIVAALAVIFTGIAGLIPAIAVQLAEGIILFAQTLAAGAPILTEAFLVILSSIITALVSSIPQITEGFAQLLIALLELLVQYTPSIVQAFFNIITSFLQVVASNVPSLIQAGVDIMIAFMQGVSSAVPQLVDAAFKMIIDFINSLAQSIETNTPILLRAIATLAISIISGLIKGLTGGISDCIEAGKDMMMGFAKGIKETFGEIVDAAKGVVSGAVDSVKKFLGIHSPSKLFSGIGEYSGEGFVEGLEGTISDAKESGENLGDAACSGLLDSVKEGGKEINAELERLNDSALEENSEFWDESNSIIEDGVENKKILEAAEIESTIDAQEKTAESHDIAIGNEEKYWEELLAIKQKGIDAEKYKSMKMEEFQEEVLTQTIDIWKKYTDELQSNTEALMNNSGIFSKVQKQEAVSAQELSKNLQDQYNQMAIYTTTLQSLNSRIADGGLKDAINKMGVDSLAELQALNSMTDAQLTDYVNLYDQKYALCQYAASLQLSSLQKETEQKLSDIFGGTDVKLFEFANAFDGTFASIKEYVATAVETGTQIAAGVGEGITAGTEQAKEDAVQMIKDTEQAAKDAALIQSPSQLFSDEVGSYIGQGVGQGISDEAATSAVTNGITALINTALEKFQSYRDNFVSVGQSCSDGFKEGILSKASEVASAAASVASNALAAARSAINSHSPSKEFMKLGQYSDEGFAIGLKTYSNKVEKASASVGQSALTSLQNAILKISDVINSDMDAQPTIRPVLDLSAIKAGEKDLHSFVGGWNGFDLSGTANFAMKAMKETISNPNPDSTAEFKKLFKELANKQYPTPLENTFYINGNNPKEIANEVSRILQKQVDRRDASWA